MDAPDPDTPEGREWLTTPEGRDWLTSDDGIEWKRTDPGWASLHSPDGREWLDDGSHEAFEAYFSGDLPPQPEWAWHRMRHRGSALDYASRKTKPRPGGRRCMRVNSSS